MHDHDDWIEGLADLVAHVRYCEEQREAQPEMTQAMFYAGLVTGYLEGVKAITRANIQHCRVVWEMQGLMGRAA